MPSLANPPSRRPVALSWKSLQCVERFVIKPAAHRQPCVLLKSDDRGRSRRSRSTVNHAPEEAASHQFALNSVENIFLDLIRGPLVNGTGEKLRIGGHNTRRHKRGRLHLIIFGTL